MSKNILLITFLCFLVSTTQYGQETFTSSQLPILVITTDDEADIPNEPKITAHLGIAWKGGGQTNFIDDPFDHYDGVIGIEKRGSSSQALFPKVGYGFETRNIDGSNNNVSLLGMPEENDWVLHGPYSDKSLMRNALAYILANQIMDYAPRVRYCEVVINNDYRGVYILTEKIKRDKNRVNISKLTPEETTGDDLTGGYILKFDKFEGATGFDGFLSQYPSYDGGGFNTFFQYHYPKYDEIAPEQEAYIKNYIQTFENVLKSNEFDDPENGYRKFLDVPAFMEYSFIQEIGRNVDGYRLSTYFHKDKESEGGKLTFGPMWDFNLAFGNVNYCIESGTAGWALRFNDFCPDDYWVVHFWWDQIWEDPTYIEEMKTYWKTLREGKLATENIVGIIDSLETLLQEPAARNFERWPVLGEHVWPNEFVGNTYYDEVEYLKRWVIERLAWIDQNMQFLGDTEYDPFNFVQPETNPNPFHSGFTFKYFCIYREQVRVEIYNAQGQLVGKLLDEGPSAGLRTLDWEANDLPNGLYFYKMKFSRGESASGYVVKS